MSSTMFVLLCIFTGYLAAMFHSVPFMTLFMLEIGVLLVLQIQVWQRKKGFQLSFRKKTMELTFGQIGILDLPSIAGIMDLHPKLILYFIVYNSEGNKIRKQKIVLMDHSSLKNPQIGMGEHSPGSYRLILKKVKIYDSFGIFSRIKKCQEEIKLFVFPQQQKLNIRFLSRTAEIKMEENVEFASARFHDSYERNELSQYQNGDSSRHIHWKISARLDELWVLKPQMESNIPVGLVIQRKDSGTVYYCILYALVLGCLQNGNIMSIYVDDTQSVGIYQFIVKNEDELRQLFLYLYGENVDRTILTKHRYREENMLQFDEKLQLWANDKIVAVFTQENYQEEIEKKSLFF